MNEEENKKSRKKRNEIRSESVKVRIDGSVLAKARELKEKGRYKKRYENEYFGYIFELGLQRYELVALPIERGEDLGKAQSSERQRRVAGD